MGKMTFTKAGLYTSIQDLGRFGFRKYGVPVSGAMDQKSAQLANLLVNNPPDYPVLEITLSGPEIHFDEDTIIAVTGADLSPRINSKAIPMNAAAQVRAGQNLAFGKPKYGIRAYLALKGGFECEKILNSCSQYFPVTHMGRIENKLMLKYQSHSGGIPNTALKPNMDHFKNENLKVLAGPEFELLDSELKQAFLEGRFKTGENNRMGYQLTSERISENDYSIITAPVIPGTVQLTPAGKLIVLMRDGQVTGGYPRVFQLTEDSINRLAQKGTGHVVRFDLINSAGKISQF